MVDQENLAHGWEQSLLRVVKEELEQLRSLIDDQTGDTELTDIQAQISRLGGLTDLVFADDLQLSRKTCIALEELSNQAMDLVRSQLASSKPSKELALETEQQAAQQMYDAILLNLPYLVEGDKSRHAMALSREAFSLLERNVGNRVGFEIVAQVVLVQDYRVMKLAGSK